MQGEQAHSLGRGPRMHPSQGASFVASTGAAKCGKECAKRACQDVLRVGVTVVLSLARQALLAQRLRRGRQEGRREGSQEGRRQR